MSKEVEGWGGFEALFGGLSLSIFGGENAGNVLEGKKETEFNLGSLVK